MPISVADMKAQFTELARTADALLGAKLADAEQMTALDFGGDARLRDQSIKYLAAHLVAMSPGGEFARLDSSKEPDGASTIYERHLTLLRRSVTGPIVI